MKATGIVRRIDDLGRVVVPKEIRRTLRIKDGDPLEIFTEREGSIVLKKYSPIGELGDFAQDFTQAIESSTSHTAVICDKDFIIACSGEGKRDYSGKPVSRPLEKIMDARSIVSRYADSGGLVPIYDGEPIEKMESQIIVPILSNGQSIGAVVLINYNKNRSLGDNDLSAAKVTSHFLGAQMAQ